MTYDEHSLWEMGSEAFRKANPHLNPASRPTPDVDFSSTPNRRKREEDIWLAWVIARATERHWERQYHTHDSRRSNPGFPDVVLCRPPRLVITELKTDRKSSKVSAEQALWLDALTRCSGGGVPEVYLWRPADRDEVLDILDMAWIAVDMWNYRATQTHWRTPEDQS